MAVRVSGACTVWALTGDCCPSPSRMQGGAACPEMGSRTCKQLKSPRERAPRALCAQQGWLPWLECPGQDPAGGREGLRADLGFAELQPRAGSGSWGLSPAALSQTWGFLLLYLFIPVPLEGGGGPQHGKVWEEGR